MNPIRCPECSQLNHRDDLAYPYCGKCHEDLVRCTTCRHSEGNACRHPRAYVRFQADGDAAAKTCADFRSRHEVRESRMAAKVPAPLWVSILLLLIFSSLAVAAWFIDPLGRYFSGNPLRVETIVPERVTLGQPFIVTMRLTNLQDRPSTRIYIEVDDDFLAVADWKQPIPRPMNIGMYHGRLLLEYPPLALGGRHVVQLPFIARQTGAIPFSAKVYAPSNQLLHTVMVPITVTEGPTGDHRRELSL